MTIILCISRVFQKRIWLTCFLSWPRFRFSTSHKVSCLFTFSFFKNQLKKVVNSIFPSLGFFRSATIFPTFLTFLSSKDSFFQAKTGAKLYPNLCNTWVVHFPVFLTPMQSCKIHFLDHFPTRNFCWHFFSLLLLPRCLFSLHNIKKVIAKT